jgi:ABC-2 type transport system permease protein
VNGPLFRRTMRAQTGKLLVVTLGLFGWGLLMPVIYATFGKDLAAIMNSVPMFQQFSEFGGGSLTSLPGAIQLGFIHPIAIALVSVFAVGFAATAVAGERQRGTLEVMLARPIGRRSVYVTLFVATIVFVAIGVAALILGSIVGSAAFDVLDEIQLANVPVLWLNGILLFGAFASIGLALSVTFDRLGAPVGITLAVLLVMFFLQILGSLWPDAKWLQPYSLFDYLRANEVLQGTLRPASMLVLGAVWLAGIAWALFVFPRRDIAAPS